MADDTITQTQNKLVLQDNLPPLPASSFDTTRTHFLSPDCNNTLLFQTADYFPAFNPTSFHGDYGLKNLKIEQPLACLDQIQDNLYSSLSSPAPGQDSPASTLPELLSLETYTQPANEQENAKKKQRNSRQKMSEKINSLGKLLPGNHPRRLTAVEVLEKTHKYISFLQAQVEALGTMPSESRLAVAAKGAAANGGLGRLSRQQLLQVVVNSPAAQSLMAEKGWCVVSAEQVALMKKVEARKKLIQHILNQIPL